MKKRFSSTIRQIGKGPFACWLLASGLALQAQELRIISTGTPPPGEPKLSFRATGSGGGFGLVINGSDIGTILLKACDVDQDGQVKPEELKDVTAACFKLWDANDDGSLATDELSSGVKALFPAPPPGAIRAVRRINGVAVEVPAGELPTPHGQTVKHVVAGSDSNKDGFLTLQELSEWVSKSFGQWDQDTGGSLDVQELNAAFGQLAKPDDAATSGNR